MNNNKELKKIYIALITFAVISIGVSYPMKFKINALEQEKIKLTETKSNMVDTRECGAWE